VTAPFLCLELFTALLRGDRRKETKTMKTILVNPMDETRRAPDEMVQRLLSSRPNAVVEALAD
jgi:hypothetical protein